MSQSYGTCVDIGSQSGGATLLGRFPGRAVGVVNVVNSAGGHGACGLSFTTAGSDRSGTGAKLGSEIVVPNNSFVESGEAGLKIGAAERSSTLAATI